MECMAEIVDIIAVEIVYIRYLVIQPMDIVIVDVLPDISMYFATKVSISENYKNYYTYDR